MTANDQKMLRALPVAHRRSKKQEWQLAGMAAEVTGGTSDDTHLADDSKRQENAAGYSGSAPPVQEERRVARDGHSYTFQEFLDHYGEEWIATYKWTTAQDTPPPQAAAVNTLLMPRTATNLRPSTNIAVTSAPPHSAAVTSDAAAAEPGDIDTRADGGGPHSAVSVGEGSRAGEQRRVASDGAVCPERRFARDQLWEDYLASEASYPVYGKRSKEWVRQVRTVRLRTGRDSHGGSICIADLDNGQEYIYWAAETASQGTASDDNLMQHFRCFPPSDDLRRHLCSPPTVVDVTGRPAFSSPRTFASEMNATLKWRHFLYFCAWEPTWLREPTYHGFGLEARKARDGLFYTEAEFVEFYGPEEAQVEWSKPHHGPACYKVR